ncbi:MAG: hypothetical protein EZS28_048127, partial [Streblomastix strix]
AWLSSMDLLRGDLFLAGHTHNGQVFPIHPLFIRLFFSHPAGLLTVTPANRKQSNINKQQNYRSNNNQKDIVYILEQKESFSRNMYVNPGTGSAGTPARTSGFSEITIINIYPE